MNREQWIQKIDLLNKLVEVGDITPKLRVEVLDSLIDKEREEWSLIEMEHLKSQEDTSASTDNK